MADLSVRYLMQLSLSYAPSIVFVASTWFCQCTPYHRCTVFCKQHSTASLQVGVLYSGETTEGGTGIVHCSNIQVLSHLPDPLTKTHYIRRESCQ